MRFNSIILKNYRQYRDVTLSFPKIKKTDLHMIVASNGVGKTNLMNAINWCLYGDEPHLGDEKDSLFIYNIDSFREAEHNGIDELTVSVEILVEEDNEYSICRKQDVLVKTGFLKKNQMVIKYFNKKGEMVIVEDDEAESIINRLLPKAIREYFFFDGEKLSNYFDAQRNSTTFVRDAINNIAQVPVLNRAYEHLKKFSKEQYENPLNKLNPNLKEISDNIEQIAERINNYKSDITKLKDQINQSEERIDEINKLINGSENVVEKNYNYQKNCKKINELENQRKAIIEELYTFVQQYISILYLYNINTKVLNFIDSKDSGLPPELNVKLLQKSLTEHICACCQRPIDIETERYFRELLEKIDISNDVIQTFAIMRPIIKQKIQQATEYKSIKEKKMISLQKIDHDIEELQQENKSLDSFIEQYSNISDIEKLMEERKNHQVIRDSNLQKLGSYKTQLERENKLLSEAKEKYQIALKEQSNSEELKKYIEFVAKAVSIIHETSDELVHEVKSEMEIETYNLFKQFIYHDDERFKYAKVELTENYKLQLIHSETHKSCLGSCSAAERQMLALAFTISLHRVSGFDSILFIDTPVGRVSDVNRKNFAKMLVELSKEKQMIFTFTPSEFSEEIQTYFNDQVRSSYRVLKGNPLVWKE